MVSLTIFFNWEGVNLSPQDHYVLAKKMYLVEFVIHANHSFGAFKNGMLKDVGIVNAIVQVSEVCNNI